MTNKFNVGDRAVLNQYYSFSFPKGTEVEVISVGEDKGRNTIIGIENLNGDSGCCFHYRLDLIEPKITKNQRITTLENKVDELELIVHQLRKPSTIQSVEDTIEFEGEHYKKVDREAREGDVVVFKSNKYPHNAEPNKPYIVNRETPYRVGHYDGDTICDVKFVIYDHGRNTETVDVYELIKEGLNPQIPIADETVELTSNKQRAEIIEKAKKFVEENSISKADAKTNKYVSIKSWKTYIEFVVNPEKRTIVALTKGIASHCVVTRGIAKCNPSDVFNEHIGKAIALGRALGLDVSEFENAVQPTEIVIGMKAYHTFSHDIWDLTETNILFADTGVMKIINDTNAQYGGVE